MIVPQNLYKVTTEKLWLESQGRSSLSLAPMDKAFVHFCEDQQIQQIIGKFFADQKQVVVLTIDPKKLVGKLVKEKNPGGSTEYFHLYQGSIPLQAVKEAKVVAFQFDKTVSK